MKIFQAKPPGPPVPPVEEPSGAVAFELAAVEQQRSTFADLIPALRTPGLKNKLVAVLTVYQHHRIGRSLARYSKQDGQILAGGMSYMGIFSITALVTLAASLFTHFFSANQHFQGLVVTSVNHYIPGLLADPDNGVQGILDPSQVAPDRGSFVAAAIALGVGLVSSTQIIRYTTEGIRAMFGLLDFPGLMLKAYLRYFAGLGLLLVAVLATAALSVLSESFEKWVVTIWPAAVQVVDTAAFDLFRLAVPSIVDFTMFFLMVRYVSRVHVPRKTLLMGSAAFAVSSLALRSGGVALIKASSDPVVAAAATVITLLLWINILARVTLYICAWMADPPAVIAKLEHSQVMGGDTPNYVTLQNPRSLNWPHHPINGDLIPATPLTGESPATESHSTDPETATQD